MDGHYGSQQAQSVHWLNRLQSNITKDTICSVLCVCIPMPIRNAPNSSGDDAGYVDNIGSSAVVLRCYHHYHRHHHHDDVGEKEQCTTTRLARWCDLQIYTNVTLITPPLPTNSETEPVYTQSMFNECVMCGQTLSPPSPEMQKGTFIRCAAVLSRTKSVGTELKPASNQREIAYARAQFWC